MHLSDVIEVGKRMGTSSTVLNNTNEFNHGYGTVQVIQHRQIMSECSPGYGATLLNDKLVKL